jgi:hypothetical protein
VIDEHPLLEILVPRLAKKQGPNTDSSRNNGDKTRLLVRGVAHARTFVRPRPVTELPFPVLITPLPRQTPARKPLPRPVIPLFDRN